VSRVGEALIRTEVSLVVAKAKQHVEATLHRGVNPGELGVATPRFLARGSWGRRGGRGVSWTGREILL